MVPSYQHFPSEIALYRFWNKAIVEYQRFGLWYKLLLKISVSFFYPWDFFVTETKQRRVFVEMKLYDFKRFLKFLGYTRFRSHLDAL